MESQLHINYLELKAVLLGLQSLCSHLESCNVKILCDNATAVSYIRNMGGSRSRNYNDITRKKSWYGVWRGSCHFQPPTYHENSTQRQKGQVENFRTVIQNDL